MGHEVTIKRGQGNLLEADVDALVNTVNTVGIMGKGIALQFKRAYPDMFKAYERAAKRHELALGAMQVWRTESLTGPRFVINFPTKGHWKSRSRIADIERGLDALVEVIKRESIRSIAVPPLGCGNGGLDWRDVRPLMERKLGDLPGVEVVIYPPGNTPAAADMPNAESTPKMTAGRAALLVAMDSYTIHAFGAPSLIETQKLAYFMQVAGQPLRLDFVKGHFGPYADDLRKTLRAIEGHFIIGFGDGSQPVQRSESLRVLPSALSLSEAALRDHPETSERLHRVLALVEGFESAYGLELLATVHWVTHANPEAAYDLDTVVADVRQWSSRKGGMFGRDHIETAWRALRERGWIRTLTSA